METFNRKFVNESEDTLSSGGYFTTLIRPGLRLISLNNNFCYLHNFWMLYDMEPVREQFQWLHDKLLEAEANDEKVHIIAHIPSGDDTNHEECSREYQKIVRRFSKTIVAEFNGHTEYFGFNLFYDKNSKPTNIAFTGGSIASYTRTNRNYVVYSVNATSFVSF
jgi:hypothetical protein